MHNKPPTVSKKHLGKWIAWDRQASKIIASGKTFDEVRAAAKEQGEVEPLMEKLPRGLFVGS